MASVLRVLGLSIPSLEDQQKEVKMSMHRSAPTSHRADNKSRRRLLFLAIVLTIIAVAGVAFAAVLANAPISGNVSGSEFKIGWKSQPTVTTSDHALCAASMGSVTMSSALPGGSCTYQGTIENQGGAAAKVSGIDLGLPQGWTAELTQGCGDTVPMPSNSVSVRFKITRTATGASAGGSIPTGSGVKAVPSEDYTAGMCV